MTDGGQQKSLNKEFEEYHQHAKSSFKEERKLIEQGIKENEEFAKRIGNPGSLPSDQNQVEGEMGIFAVVSGYTLIHSIPPANLNLYEDEHSNGKLVYEGTIWGAELGTFPNFPVSGVIDKLNSKVTRVSLYIQNTQKDRTTFSFYKEGLLICSLAAPKIDMDFSFAGGDGIFVKI